MHLDKEETVNKCCASERGHRISDMDLCDRKEKKGENGVLYGKGADHQNGGCS